MSKIYVTPNAYLERSETFFCRGFCRGFQTAICRREVRHERKLTWGRRPQVSLRSCATLRMVWLEYVILKK